MFLGTKLLAPPIDTVLHSEFVNAYPWIQGSCAILLMSIIIALFGWLTGLSFPKRAEKGVRFVFVMLYGFAICQAFFKFGNFEEAISLAIPGVVFGTIGILSARCVAAGAVRTSAAIARNASE